MKRRQKAGFWGLISSKITQSKGGRKKKSEEEERRKRNKKSNGCTLSFLMATLKIVFGREKKKLLDAKGPFGGNVFKYPARYILGDPGSREKAGRKFSSMGERAPGLDIAYIGSRKSFVERKNHYTSHEVCKCDTRNYQRGAFLSAWWWRKMSSKTPAFPSYTETYCLRKTERKLKLCV